MTRVRLTIALVVLVMSLLQAWDSRVFTAGLPVILLVGIAIAAYVASVLMVGRTALAFPAVGISVVCLLAAKLISPHPLPALGVILAPFAVLLWVLPRLEARHARTDQPGTAPS